MGSITFFVLVLLTLIADPLHAEPRRDHHQQQQQHRLDQPSWPNATSHSSSLGSVRDISGACVDEASNSGGGCRSFQLCCTRRCGGQDYTVRCVTTNGKINGQCTCDGLSSGGGLGGGSGESGEEIGGGHDHNRPTTPAWGSTDGDDNADSVGGGSRQQMRIPPHVLASLQNATTFAELEQRLRVIPSSRTISLARPRTGAIPVGGNNGSVINDPKQSQDSCKLINICVPLPVHEFTGVLLFPKCIELSQCLGGCCANGNDCHATQLEPVRVKYKRWRIVDDTGLAAFEFLDENLADMTRHKSCGCYQCLNKPVCNDRQELVNCKCQCKDTDEKNQCQGSRRRWSDEKCECRCAATTCSLSTYFNPRTCSCDHLRRFDEPTYDEQPFTTIVRT